MDHKDKAFKISIGSICLLIVMVFFLNTSDISNYGNALQILGSILSLTFAVPAIYIWVDGFKRFEPTIGHYGGKWMLYVTFNLFAGLYLHHVYRKNV